MRTFINLIKMNQLDEEVYYFTPNGSCITYRQDGSVPKNNTQPQYLFTASTLFQNQCKSFHCITAANGKIIAFYPLPDEGLLIYISPNKYCPLAIEKFLRSQAAMILAFNSNFVRPIHMNGMHMHNMFGAPRIYPRIFDKNTQQLIQDIITATQSPICAMYAQNMIVFASDDFWKLAKRDIHAIDLLARHCEAPFTDQIINLEDGQHKRALIYHVFKTMKLVTINGGTFDALQAAAQTLPEVLYKKYDFLKSLEQTPPIVNKQEGVIGWMIIDLATHRYFGDCPDEIEGQFIEMICKCFDITDNNRVKHISMRLSEHMFFYIPQILVRDTKYFNQSHYWTFFIMHDLHKTIDEIRKFCADTMVYLLRYVKPYNAVEPYIQDVMNRFNL